MYSHKFKKSGLNALRKIPRPIAQKIMSELESIAQDPESYNGDWKRLKGRP